MQYFKIAPNLFIPNTPRNHCITYTNFTARDNLQLSDAWWSLNSTRQKDSQGALVTSFQSRERTVKVVVIYLARKRKIFDECLKPLAFNLLNRNRTNLYEKHQELFGTLQLSRIWTHRQP